MNGPSLRAYLERDRALLGSTRVTEDIDVTVALGEHTARALVTALTRKAFTLRPKIVAGQRAGDD